METDSLDGYKAKNDDGGNQDVKNEKSAHTIGEKLLKEKCGIHTVFREPTEELPVWN